MRTLLYASQCVHVVSLITQAGKFYSASFTATTTIESLVAQLGSIEYEQSLLLIIG